MQHRIVHVEGLPGSGKSTTSQYIYLQMLANGLDAEWVYEEEPGHPIRVKLGDCATPDEFARRMLVCWRAFAERHAGADRITVFESVLLQSSVERMRQAGMPEWQIRRYVADVAEICEPFAPALIQIDEADVSGALRRVCESRGEGWTDWFTGWMADFPYARERGRTGFEGLVACYADFREMNDGLIEGAGIPVFRLERNASDWGLHNRTVLAFLGLEDRGLPAAPQEELARLVGKYEIVEGPPRNGASHHAVRLEGDGLVVEDFWFPTSRLIYKEDGAFLIEGSCVELWFRERDDGRMEMRLGGKWRGWIQERVMVRR